MSQYISPKWNLFISRPTALLKREFLKETYLHLNDFSGLKITRLLIVASEKENHVFIPKNEDSRCEKLAEGHYLKKQAEKYLAEFLLRVKKFKAPPAALLGQALYAFRTVGATLIYTFYLERALTKYNNYARGREKKRLGRLIADNSRLRDQGACIMYGLYDQFRAQFKHDVDYYLLDEVVKNKPVGADELKRRKDSFVALLKKDQTRIYTGRAAKKFLQKEEFKTLKIDCSVNAIRGLSVFKGAVQGEIVKIRNLADFQTKNYAGKIIVATDTLIEYMPYLKKVAAIITDCGGITCHAAITAREYKIPAIVGAKIATQIFKDGQIVEVDADKGVVKIIK